MSDKIREILKSAEPWATSIARGDKDQRPGSAYEFLEDDELIPMLAKVVAYMEFRLAASSGENDPSPAPDEGQSQEILGYLLYCASLWHPDARLVGNLRANDIVRALKLFQAKIDKLEEQNIALREALQKADLGIVAGQAVRSQEEFTRWSHEVQSQRPHGDLIVE